MHMIGDEYVDVAAGYIGQGATAAYNWYTTPSNSTYVSKKGNMNKFNWGRRDILMGAPSGRYHTSRKRARSMSRRPNFSQKGYLRTGGNYGRYNPSGGPFSQELKFFDLAIASTTIPTTGEITKASVNTIAQGTTQSTRIGRKIVIKKLLWKFVVTLPEAGNMTQASDILRIILYVDKQCNGATAAVLDIIDSTSLSAFRALDNSQRFNILMDKTINIFSSAGSGNGTASDSAEKHIAMRFYKNLSIPVEFSSTTGAITEIRSDNIGVLCISHQGYVGIEGFMRLRYKG